MPWIRAVVVSLGPEDGRLDANAAVDSKAAHLKGIGEPGRRPDPLEQALGVGVDALRVFNQGRAFALKLVVDADGETGHDVP